MPRQKHDARLYELARHGAEARLRDLFHEVRLLVDMFPHLRDSFDPDELPVNFILEQGAREVSGGARPATGRRKWSTAQRKAAAQRMKAYWAKRKTAEKS
jgi:hypothetical protein